MSHNTIHIFKNYFATIFSVFSFSNNKFNSNGLYVFSGSDWLDRFEREWKTWENVSTKKKKKKKKEIK